jgi:hypothetical protein
MNAVYARGPGDSRDWYGDELERRNYAISREADEISKERKSDLEWLEMAACDALTETTINAIKADTGTEAMAKAAAYKYRATILSLISTGADDAELGRLMRVAANDAFIRTCWDAAERFVDHMHKCGVVT